MSSPDGDDQKVSNDTAVPKDTSTSKNTSTSKDVVIFEDTEVSEHPLFKLANTFFPGTSYFFFILYRYFKKSPGLYTRPAIVIFGLGMLWRYAYPKVSGYVMRLIGQHFMTRAEIREGDEIYNIVMAWVNRQRFAQDSKSFQVATNVMHDPYWGLDRFEKKKIKEEPLKYSPSFGSYRFWHEGRLFFFGSINYGFILICFDITFLAFF